MVALNVDSSIQASVMRNVHLTLLLKPKTKMIWSVLAALTQRVSFVMLMILKFANDVRQAFMCLKTGA